MKDKNPCYLKHACKGISVLISYGLCYNNDLMNKTYSNYCKNIKKKAENKIHRKNIEESLTSYWSTNSFNQVNARYGGSLFGKKKNFTLVHFMVLNLKFNMVTLVKW